MLNPLNDFFYQTLGPESGKKLVFLHGLMGTSANWRKIVPTFEADYQILIYDQRGHGRSFQPKSGYKPEDFAEDLRRILDALGWKTINLVGHSMGGRNSMVFASLYPERVEKLVIEDITVEPPTETMGRISDWLQMIPTPFASKLKAKEFLSNDFVQMLGGGKGAQTLGAFFYTNLDEKTPGVVDWRFYKPGIEETMDLGRVQDRWREWRALTMPTLLIRGEKSLELPRKDFEKMLSLQPNARGVEIAGAGHWVHSEKPEAFTDALREFLTF